MEYLVLTQIAQSIQELANQVHEHNGPCCVYSYAQVDNYPSTTEAQQALVEALGGTGSVIVFANICDIGWGFRVTPLTDLSPSEFVDRGAYI